MYIYKAKLPDLLFSISTSMDAKEFNNPFYSSMRLLSELVLNKDLSLSMLSNELTSELNNDNLSNAMHNSP